jgi:hypothetical protein
LTGKEKDIVRKNRPTGGRKACSCDMTADKLFVVSISIKLAHGGNACIIILESTLKQRETPKKIGGAALRLIHATNEFSHKLSFHPRSDLCFVNLAFYV